MPLGSVPCRWDLCHTVGICTFGILGSILGPAAYWRTEARPCHAPRSLSLLTTYYLLLATYYLLLTTYYLLLATYYLLPATSYFLLPTLTTLPESTVVWRVTVPS